MCNLAGPSVLLGALLLANTLLVLVLAANTAPALLCWSDAVFPVFGQPHEPGLSVRPSVRLSGQPRND